MARRHKRGAYRLLIIDAHLDLAWNALQWNRDLLTSVHVIRSLEPVPVVPLSLFTHWRWRPRGWGGPGLAGATEPGRASDSQGGSRAGRMSPGHPALGFGDAGRIGRVGTSFHGNDLPHHAGRHGVTRIEGHPAASSLSRSSSFMMAQVSRSQYSSRSCRSLSRSSSGILCATNSSRAISTLASLPSTMTRSS